MDGKWLRKFCDNDNENELDEVDGDGKGLLNRILKSRGSSSWDQTTSDKRSFALNVKFCTKNEHGDAEMGDELTVVDDKVVAGDDIENEPADDLNFWLKLW